MLKGIDALLSPELLKILCEMGHGDEVAVVDANFTAESLGRGKPIVRLPGCDLYRTCAAVLSVFPLDAAVTQPVAYMQVSDSPAGFTSTVQLSVIVLLEAGDLARPEQCEAMERFSFYERVKQAYAIVQTGEMQSYANFIFKKGVIN
ncbi:RbsD/FucU domain-containing protein [Glaciimonas sp. Gout2]|uniref:RbsD/FucU family protein n=1 Tax=unclassified Glaciimonas TaxID=2644401 RepID=UPI002B228F7A|nr:MULTISPECIES: RbsD/FucU domain-containing protein [unclassified Glaciimonas]MEB0010903.1 RbsD/FucU domain-containing protein [Glaciimonas sp. Cout2]MEB0081685.1 RbsD/FucU domain-containing protein [Glaciimonas sp. Gout2]